MEKKAKEEEEKKKAEAAERQKKIERGEIDPDQEGKESCLCNSMA